MCSDLGRGTPQKPYLLKKKGSDEKEKRMIFLRPVTK